MGDMYLLQQQGGELGLGDVGLGVGDWKMWVRGKEKGRTRGRKPEIPYKNVTAPKPDNDVLTGNNDRQTPKAQKPRRKTWT